MCTLKSTNHNLYVQNLRARTKFTLDPQEVKWKSKLECIKTIDRGCLPYTGLHVKLHICVRTPKSRFVRHWVGNPTRPLPWTRRHILSIQTKTTPSNRFRSRHPLRPSPTMTSSQFNPVLAAYQNEVRATPLQYINKQAYTRENSYR